MREDAERWEAKYLAADPDPELRTDPLLSSHLADLHSVGSALDLASGSCHSAVFLAQQGYDVLAVDCSATGLAIGRRLAQREQTTIRTLTADLDEIMLDKETYDLVVCLRYLNRALFSNMKTVLKPGGLLFFKTFNVHHLVSSPKFNPAYVLQPGELSQSFKGMVMIDLNDGEDPKITQSWIVARCWQ